MPDSHMNTAPAVRIYPADRLPQSQGLLSALADLDLAYERDLEVVRDSTANADLKTMTINTLSQRHQERRKPIVRRLAALQDWVRT
jgi:hypothetical protein